MKTRYFGLIATAALIAACSSHETDAEPEPQDILPSTTALAEATRCPIPDPDATDPDDVADAVATTIACHDTRSDKSPLDAQRRARAWLADHLIPDPGAEVRPPREWTEWANQNAYLKVTTVEDVVPWDDVPDRSQSPLQLARHTIATPTNDDGPLEWGGADVEDELVLTLEKQDDGRWIVTDIDTY